LQLFGIVQKTSKLIQLLRALTASTKKIAVSSQNDTDVHQRHYPSVVGLKSCSLVDIHRKRL